MRNFDHLALIVWAVSQKDAGLFSPTQYLEISNLLVDTGVADQALHELLARIYYEPNVRRTIQVTLAVHYTRNRVFF